MNWDEYGIQIAQVAALKSKDPWKKVGAAILREDNTIGGIGYNGFPQGVKEDWENRDERRLLVVHAEQNALRYLKPGEGKTLYSTLLPCNECLKTIAAYQIKRVLYQEIYEQDSSSLSIAEKLGIEIIQYKKPNLKSFWDHSQKPSAFVILKDGIEIHRGCYKIGEQLLGIKTN
jgi:dCMP deaminase